MKKWIPYIVVGAFAIWILSALRPPAPKNGFDIAAFGRLPVLLDGRIQPLDSVARNSLLSIQGKQVVRLEGGKSLSALEWLMDVMMKPQEADKYKFFRVQHPDVQSLLGNRGNGLEYYSFNDMAPNLEKIEEQARPIIEAEEKKQMDPQQETAMQKDLLHLYNSIIRYHRLKNTIRVEGAEDFPAEIDLYERSIGPGLVALQRSEAKQDYNERDLQVIVSFFKRYEEVGRYAYALVVPPTDPQQARDAWSNIGTSLMDSMKAGQVNPAVKAYAAMAGAYGKENAIDFNNAVSAYNQWLTDKGLAKEMKKGQNEFLFNQGQLFYNGMILYVLAFLLAVIYWLNLSDSVYRTAYGLICLTFVVHTFGLGFRMFLEGRPPVTNLYSSAIFVGWGSVLLTMILERIYRNGIGIVVGGFVGFSTLIIAHHLALAGDTMEMLRAVLDTNFWLATHVVAVTTGYASMFVAGFLAIVYVFLGVFTPRLTQVMTAGTAKAVTLGLALTGGAHAGIKAAKITSNAVGVETTGKVLTRMTYGIVCFATLFSFVGTILGGIWADQSWGRFWGWDPKENGALLIVLWCAVMLHARWGGLVKERGLAVMAVFGNIVTSLSWFGVNMLGVGLHSYGFMDKAFPWLVAFIISQFAIMGLGLMPLNRWASFRNLPAEKKSPEQGPVKGKLAPA